MDKITIKNPQNTCLEEEFVSDDKALVVEVADLSQVSDGYHTIAELYDHRITLYIALCRMIEFFYGEMDQSHAPLRVWRSKFHDDGSPAYEGWFVLGIGEDPGEIITYHIPLSRWSETDFAPEIERAHFDGHTSNDVLERLKTL